MHVGEGCGVLRHGRRPEAAGAHGAVQVSRSHGPGRHTLRPTRSEYVFLYLRENSTCNFFIYKKQCIDTFEIIAVPQPAFARNHE